MTKIGIILAFTSLVNLILPWGIGQVAARNTAASLTPPGPPTVVDVALAAGGILSGHVDAKQFADNPIRLIASDGTTVSFQPSADGAFQIKGVPGGTYQITAGDTTTSLRLWKAETAPPSACATLKLDQQTLVARGQQPLSALMPNGESIFIGLLLAAAIVIPIVVHNSGDDGDGS